MCIRDRVGSLLCQAEFVLRLLAAFALAAFSRRHAHALRTALRLGRVDRLPMLRAACDKMYRYDRL